MLSSIIVLHDLQIKATSPTLTIWEKCSALQTKVDYNWAAGAYSCQDMQNRICSTPTDIRHIDEKCNNTNCINGALRSFNNGSTNQYYCICDKVRLEDNLTCADTCPQNDTIKYFDSQGYCVKVCPVGFTIDLTGTKCIEITLCFAQAFINSSTKIPSTKIIQNLTNDVLQRWCVCDNISHLLQTNNITCVPSCIKDIMIQDKNKCSCNKSQSIYDPLCPCTELQIMVPQAPNSNIYVCLDKCKDGKVLNFNHTSCDDSCPQGLINVSSVCQCNPNNYTQECPCPNYQPYKMNGQCLRFCPQYYYVNSFYECAPVVQNCTNLTVLDYDGTCKPKCSGVVIYQLEVSVELVCMKVCPMGLYLDFNNRCVVRCPGNSGFDEDNKCTCGIKKLNVQRDLCVDQCGANEKIDVNGYCVCDPSFKYVVNGVCSATCEAVWRYGYDRVKCLLKTDCAFPNALFDSNQTNEDAYDFVLFDPTQPKKGLVCNQGCSSFVDRATSMCIETCAYVNESFKICESEASCVHRDPIQSGFTCKASCSSAQIAMDMMCVNKCAQFIENYTCVDACDSAVYTVLNNTNICSTKAQCVQPNGLFFISTQYQCKDCTGYYYSREDKICSTTCTYINETTCESPNDKINCPFVRANPVQNDLDLTYNCVKACLDDVEIAVDGVCVIKPKKNMSSTTVYAILGVLGVVAVVSVALMIVTCAKRKGNVTEHEEKLIEKIEPSKYSAAKEDAEMAPKAKVAHKKPAPKKMPPKILQ
ncbi:Conserved_hypothetical protein [Hexamita inflata]|uniref:Uncharacterized protein n=1 Tax=Hexamita inflata TaxID=28002 RepID=A0AA86TFI0_9EUKA|nr:Conserved hypothetical protein [Hexamita inflata]